MRKVVDTLNDLDNVLYEIGNECGGYATEWQYHRVRFVKGYESTKPQQHPVGMTVQIRDPDANNTVLYDSPADWISPNGDEGYWDDPPAADGRKVIIADSDHIRAKPSAAHRQWIWKCFLRGHNPIFLDMYPKQESEQLDEITDSRLDPQWEPIRAAMGYTRTWANRIHLAAMTPRNELASTTYCLANPGEEYLVYLPDGGQVTVDLTTAAGWLSVEWFDPLSGKSTVADSIHGGGRSHFTAPFRSDALLHLALERP